MVSSPLPLTEPIEKVKYIQNNYHLYTISDIEYTKGHNNQVYFPFVPDQAKRKGEVSTVYYAQRSFVILYETHIKDYLVVFFVTYKYSMVLLLHYYRV